MDDVSSIERYHHFDGQLLTVMMIFHETNATIQTHAHKADHTLTVSRGSLEVIEDGKVETWMAPAIGVIKAGVPHSLRSLEPISIATCALIPRGEDGRTLTSEEMANMTAFDLWRAQERV